VCVSVVVASPDVEEEGFSDSVFVLLRCHVSTATVMGEVGWGCILGGRVARGGGLGVRRTTVLLRGLCRDRQQSEHGGRSWAGTDCPKHPCGRRLTSSLVLLVGLSWLAVAVDVDVEKVVIVWIELGWIGW